MNKSKNLQLIEEIKLTGPASQAILIKLNRPETKNCLNLYMLDRMREIVCASKKKSILLTGAGPFFCSGLDTKEIFEHKNVSRHLKTFVNLLNDLRIHPSPTACILNGDAMGGGVGLALVQRYVVSVPGAILKLPQKKAFAPLLRTLEPILEWRQQDEFQRLSVAAGISATKASEVGLINDCSEIGPSLAEEVAGIIDSNNRCFERMDESSWEEVVRCCEEATSESNEKLLLDELEKIYA